MQVEQTFTVNAPIESLWDFLMDIEQMSLCIPGATGVQAIDHNLYQGTLKVKIGPVSASFEGTGKILETDPPVRLVGEGSATDGRTKSQATATFTAELRPLSDSQTEIAYLVNFSIRGRLGQFGQGVMRQVAKQMTADFATCVENRLAVPPEPEPEPTTLGETARSAPPDTTPAPPIDLVATLVPAGNAFWMIACGLLGFLIGYFVGSRSRRR